MAKKRRQQQPEPGPVPGVSEGDLKPNWKWRCENCGASPTMPLTGMCGPCTFGESDTADGDW